MELVGGGRHGPLLVELVVAGLVNFQELDVLLVAEGLLVRIKDAVALTEGEQIVLVHGVNVLGHLAAYCVVTILKAIQVDRERPVEAVAVANGAEDGAGPVLPDLAAELFLDAALVEGLPQDEHRVVAHGGVRLLPGRWRVAADHLEPLVEGQAEVLLGQLAVPMSHWVVRLGLPLAEDAGLASVEVRPDLDRREHLSGLPVADLLLTH